MIQSKRLADLVGDGLIVRGLTTFRTASTGEIPVMSIADLRAQRPARHFVDPENLLESEELIAVPGDVLISIEGGTVGEGLVVGKNQSTFVPSQQVAMIRIGDHQKLDPWFLVAWLGSEQGVTSLKTITRGAGIQRISRNDLYKLEVPVPPLRDQKNIGELARNFNETIQSHRRVIAQMEELLPIEINVAIRIAFQ